MEGIKAVERLFWSNISGVVLVHVEIPLGTTRAMVTTFSLSFLSALVTLINIMTHLSTADPCIVWVTLKQLLKFNFRNRPTNRQVIITAFYFPVRCLIAFCESELPINRLNMLVLTQCKQDSFLIIIYLTVLNAL